MLRIVENFLIENNIKNKTVVLGFSAGPDSCTLALLLNKLKEKYNLQIVLAYFNHKWRAEAEDEEDFTRNFAKKYNLKYFIECANSDAKKTEEKARELRYNFFKNAAKKFNTDTVFLAHNKNDNIETLIYRLIKGTSIKGLRSIPKIRDIYYRPLLDSKKEDILAFLAQEGQDYMIDLSNEDVKYKRNLIRKKILPLFKEINPNYIENINNLIKNANAQSKIIEDKINEIKKELIFDNKINYEKFTSLKKEYRYEIIDSFFSDELKVRDFKTIKKIDDNILSKKKLSLNSESFLSVKNNFIKIEKKSNRNKNELIINNVGEYDFENITLKIEKNENKNIKIKSDKKSCYLNFSFPLVLRHRKNGDKFSPFGANSQNKKLKDYLINQKIEQSKKDELILLCKNNDVCWVLGYHTSDKFKVIDNNFYKLTLEQKNERY